MKKFLLFDIGVAHTLATYCHDHREGTQRVILFKIADVRCIQ
jgi:hypothetical protein